jgi:hypothetical protein
MDHVRLRKHAGSIQGRVLAEAVAYDCSRLNTESGP